MIILRQITDFFISLKTTLWSLGILLALMFAGAFIMPGRQEFQMLHAIPLFDWMLQQPLEITWWLWGITGVLAVLSINTLFCSIESIIKKRKVTHWLLLISPQIIHIGFLFILLAHLLSGFGASQSLEIAREGDLVRLTNDDILKVRDIRIDLDYDGYVTDWEVGLEYLSSGKAFMKDRIKPNSPSVHMGFNINVKDLRSYPETVLLQINREPGALWALIGGIVFTLGILILVPLKIRGESSISTELKQSS